MAQSTNTVLIAAAKTAADTNASEADQTAATQIVNGVCQFNPGDRVLVQTATIFWDGTFVRKGDVLGVECITLADTTSIVSIGQYTTALSGWKWDNDEKLPNAGIIHVATQGVMAIIRKGAV